MKKIPAKTHTLKLGDLEKAHLTDGTFRAFLRPIGSTKLITVGDRFRLAPKTDVVLYATRVFTKSLNDFTEAELYAAGYDDAGPVADVVEMLHLDWDGPGDQFYWVKRKPRFKVLAKDNPVCQLVFVRKHQQR